MSTEVSSISYWKVSLLKTSVVPAKNRKCKKYLKEREGDNQINILLRIFRRAAS